MSEKKKIAILGAGNMGGAIAASLAGGEYDLAVTASSAATLDKVREVCPEAVCSLSNAEAAEGADVVILAVKPYVAPEVVREIRMCLKPGVTVVSVVAGLTLSALAEAFAGCGFTPGFARVIPNTAIRNGKSVTFISPSDNMGEDDIKTLLSVFSKSGKVFVVAEKDMAACTALSSCGIAFFLRFIRAAVEGAVELGLSPRFATEVAAFTAEGAASLLEGGNHPEAEIDKVTTPGGLTIRGLNELERNGLTAAVVAALKASV